MDGDVLTYRFGRAGDPELELPQTILEVGYEPWPGVGRTYYESARFQNEGYTYEVWLAADRLELDAPREGGVRVMQGESVVAEVPCIPDSWEGDLYAIYEAREANGQCWDYGTHDWTRCSQD